MFIYYDSSLDCLSGTPERVIGATARVMLNFNDVKMRRHSRRFRRILRVRRGRWR